MQLLAIDVDSGRLIVGVAIPLDGLADNEATNAALEHAFGRFIDLPELSAADGRYQCPDCDWQGELDDLDGLHHVHHLADEISAGYLCPAGTCPECHAMIDIEDADVPDWTLQTVAHIMRERGWTVTEPVPFGDHYPQTTSQTGPVESSCSN